jgi:hypothetical protein
MLIGIVALCMAFVGILSMNQSPQDAYAATARTDPLDLTDSDDSNLTEGWDWDYDIGGSTLTLTGVDIETSSAAIHFEPSVASSVTIVLVDGYTNTTTYSGIFGEFDNDLIITGSGTLDITSTGATGIHNAGSAGNIYINGGTINISAYYDAYTYGIYSDGVVTIDGDANVTIYANNTIGGSGVGILGDGGTVIGGNAVVVATGTSTGYGDGYGANGNVVINGGDVTFIGKTSAFEIAPTININPYKYWVNTDTSAPTNGALSSDTLYSYSDADKYVRFVKVTPTPNPGVPDTGVNLKY